MHYDVEKFYSWSSFATLAGMSSALWLVAGTVSTAFDWLYPAWFPLALAAAFVVCGDFTHRRYGTPRHPWSALPLRVPLWLVNACLVYSTAVGGAGVAAERERGARAEVRRSGERVEEGAERPGFGWMGEEGLLRIGH